MGTFQLQKEFNPSDAMRSFSFLSNPNPKDTSPGRGEDHITGTKQRKHLNRTTGTTKMVKNTY